MSNSRLIQGSIDISFYQVLDITDVYYMIAFKAQQYYPETKLTVYDFDQ